jgi:hypothetical protein
MRINKSKELNIYNESNKVYNKVSNTLDNTIYTLIKWKLILIYLNLFYIIEIQ